MAGGAAAATTGRGLMKLLAGGREACLVDFGGSSAAMDIYVLCHEVRGMDLSPGEQLSVSLRDLTRSDPEKETMPGRPWELRQVRSEAVLQLRAWASSSPDSRRHLGELRLPIAQLRALGLNMLYQTWITLDPDPEMPGSQGLGLSDLEQKMNDGSRQLFQPKVCLSLCKAEDVTDGKMTLGFDISNDLKDERWSALLRSQMQHVTMSHGLHLQGLKLVSLRNCTQSWSHGTPAMADAPTSQPSSKTLGTETSRKVKIFEKGSARNVMPATEGWFGLGGRFLPKDLTTLEGLNATYATKEILLGITIGFAQVPESVAFAFLAHVRPHVALHAAWVMGLFCSLLGGRPGMVNGATGAFAAIIATFLPVPSVPGGNGEHVELLFPSVMLAGLLMLAASASNLSRFILLLPTPVMVGFCNGLAIVIGLAQLHPFHSEETHSGWKEGFELMWMLVITAVSMITMEFLPKVPLQIFKVIPSSLMAILVAILLEFAVVRRCGSRTDTIGDVSEFTAETAFPIPFFVDHPSTGYDLSKIGSWTSIQNIIVQGILLCVVGSIESLMTSEVVESSTKTPSHGDRSLFAIGLGNIVSGNGGEFAGVVQTIEYMQKMGLQPSAQTFLYGMRAAERAGEINQGLELFRRMKARGIKTNEKIDEALMRISLVANDPDRALQFFDAALQRRQNWGRRNPEEPVRRELGIYRQALRACELGAASGLPPGAGVVSYQDYALQLLLELQKAELPIDGTMYLHAVTTCEYQRSWLRVISLLREMKQNGIAVEGERIRSAYWNGVQAADEDDNVDQAFELFEQMRENQLTLEPFMYITMVRILEKHGQLARAHSVDTDFRELQMKEFSKELMIYRKRNEWQEAIGVLDKIREQNLTPTLKVFNTAMSALQRPGKWELVLELMEDMRKDGHVLDACSHTVAISAMISAGEVQRAVQQLEIMKQQKVPPTSLTYGRLIYALEEAGHPEQALYLWDELREKRIEPDRVAYEAAIRACRSCEFWAAILELFGEMQEKDKGPSKASKESASLAAERLGLTESVMKGAVPASDTGMLEAAATP